MLLLIFTSTAVNDQAESDYDWMANPIPWEYLLVAIGG